MQLKDIGMIAADTSRTYIYLKALIENDILPNHVIVLVNDESRLKPGQANSSSKEKLIETLKESRIPFSVSNYSNINSKEFISLIKHRQEDVFIYSGFGGVLLRSEVLNAGKLFLHVHGGFLPDYKGSTTNYYSILNENTVGASSIFLTKDIDCGPVIQRKKFPIPADKSTIDHIYDSEVRSQVLIDTLKNYILKGKFEFELEDNSGGETFYIIHPVLKHISILGN